MALEPITTRRVDRLELRWSPADLAALSPEDREAIPRLLGAAVRAALRRGLIREAIFHPAWGDPLADVWVELRR